jgi:enoyl-CoA hydratase
MSGVQGTAGEPDAEVVFRRLGVVGHILLNRPRALNALTHGMVRAIHAALDDWAVDGSVRTVVIEGAGGKAFCAGGDIRVLHDHGKAGRHGEALAFWRDEYELNVRIRRYPKPYVALVDGIVMGGGVGVSLHGSHLVAGERFVFAMPEVGIGFFPDVGATYELPRLPSLAGRYIALTGARIGAVDAAALGLATAAVESSGFDGIRDALADGGEPSAVISAAAPAAGPARLGEAERAVVARCFAADSVTGILAALDAAAVAGSAFAAETAATMRGKSPLSLAIALEQMKRGAGLSFEEAMRLEFRIVSQMMRNADFFEGVRAAVIDKDQSPRWAPGDMAAVKPAMVETFFLPLDHELAADGRRRP